MTTAHSVTNTNAIERSIVMLEKTAQEFISDAERLLTGAVANDDFVKIKTSVGNAVLISEAEWNVLVDALKIVLSGEVK